MLKTAIRESTVLPRLQKFLQKVRHPRDAPWESGLQGSPSRAGLRQKPLPFPWPATLAKMRGRSKPRWFCLGPLADTQISTLHSIRDHLEERHGLCFIFSQGAGEEEVARKPTLRALRSRILYRAWRHFPKQAQVTLTPECSCQV